MYTIGCVLTCAHNFWHLCSQMHVFEITFIYVTVIESQDTKKPAFVVQSFQLVHNTMYGNVKDNFVYLFVTNSDH